MPGEQGVTVNPLNFRLSQQSQAEGRLHERPGVDFVVALGNHRNSHSGSIAHGESETMPEGLVSCFMGVKSFYGASDSVSVSLVTCRIWWVQKERDRGGVGYVGNAQIE